MSLPLREEPTPRYRPLIATSIFWRFGASSPYLLGALILLPPVAMTLGLPPPAKKDGLRSPGVYSQDG